MGATVRVWVYSLADGVLVQELNCGRHVFTRDEARWLIDLIEHCWDTTSVLGRPMRIPRSDAVIVAMCDQWDEPVVMVPDRKGGG